MDKVSACSLRRSNKRRKPQTCDPEVAKRRSLVKSNPDVPAEEMCEIFDRQHLPLTIEIGGIVGFRTWPEAYRHPHYRKRIQVLITKEARRESKVWTSRWSPKRLIWLPGEVETTIWTHKINGLTESDFILAAKIDQIHGS